MFSFNIQDWLTCAERTNWQETSRYPEVIDYCRRMQEASPFIRYSRFGLTPQGRDLPLLTVSSRGIFTPEDARQSGDPVVLIINGIHPGEIAGKEASFLLLRDIALSQELIGLLDHVTLLIVPIFNVDGHERCSPYNRLNQNGPKEMGFRTTAQNLNLNRDWVKAESPEMQAMLRLYNAWLPDMVIDNHVTNGGDYQYDVSYIIDDHDGVAPSVRHYLKQYLEPYLEEELRRLGCVPMIYFEFRDTNDPAAGISSPPLSARYSDGYGTVQNRPSIVVETHMLKTFEVRIQAHYNLMLAVLQKLNEEPEVLRSAVDTADAMSMEFAPGTEYPLSIELTDEAEPYLFAGIEYTHEPSDISGGTKITYGTEPRDMVIPFFRTTYADKSASIPPGYIIPVQWQPAIDRLDLHGIQYTRLNEELSGEFETYRFRNVSFAGRPYEGRQLPTYESYRTRENRILPAGSAVVRTNQRCNRLILCLLEPDSPDSLIAWGFFNAIFEDKEYGEPYILEKLAARMLQESDSLREEFEELLEDPDFADSPMARLLFFYNRSPYKDPQKDAYPIVRLL